MKADLRGHVLATVKREVGENPSLPELVEHLISSGAIDRNTANHYVINTEFFQRLRIGPEKTVGDLEAQMAAEYGMSIRWMRYLRTPHRGRRKVQ